MMNKKVERTHPEDRKVVMWMSPNGYRYWESLLKKEALRILKEMENEQTTN